MKRLRRIGALSRVIAEQQIRLETQAATIREQRGHNNALLSGHQDPHFSPEGGCLCTCVRCLGWRRSQGYATDRWSGVCICPACSQQCPSAKLDANGSFTYDRPAYEPVGES